MNQRYQAEPDSDRDWLGMAIALARKNVAAGGWPFGAVVVRDGELLATGVNDVTADNDPTAHAEIRAIRDACAQAGEISLTGAVLYSSCEPCPMCMAAAIWAGLSAVVFAAESADAARAGFDDQEIYHLFDLPREDWPLSVRHQEHSWADSPLKAWVLSRQGE